MKPVNENLHDRFYEESVEGIDAVMRRLMEVLGNPMYVSHAMALDVSENTVKTWRRRGFIPMKYLQGFAAKHGVSIDYLMRGEAKSASEEIALSNEERLMLDRYRTSSRELRDAALRVLLGGVAPTPAKKTKKVSAAVTQSGDGNVFNQSQGDGHDGSASGGQWKR